MSSAYEDLMFLSLEEAAEILQVPKRTLVRMILEKKVAASNLDQLALTEGGSCETDMSKPRILVVEDHPDSRDVLVLAMESSGYEVVEARNGKEAMARIAAGDFDLVIIDIAIPFVSGRELARFIKSNPRTKHIPLLAATALGSAEYRKICSEAGFDDFLFKPFSMTDLKAKVQLLLSQKSHP
jgi:CheY-like chemotaxis protein